MPDQSHRMGNRMVIADQAAGACEIGSGIQVLETGIDTTKPKLGVRAGWLLAMLAFVPFAVLRAGDLSEADTFWQIRTGLFTIAHRSIPAVDTFSWTMRGKPWSLNSWGFNV